MLNARDVAVAALFGVGYYAFSRAGLHFIDPVKGVAVIWPASGYALAVFLLRTRSTWPLMAVAVFVSNLIAETGVRHLDTSTLLALANAAEPVLAAEAARRVGRTDSWRGQVNIRMVAGIVAAAVLANGLTALLGGATVAQEFHTSLGDDWLTWWLADGLGMLAIAPVILFLVRSEHGDRTSMALDAVSVAVCVAAAAVVFWHPLHGSLRLLSYPWVVFPPLMWCASRTEQRAPAVASAAVALIAATATVHGYGPFDTASTSADDRVAALQSFLAMAALSTLVATTFVTQIRAAEQRAHRSDERTRSAYRSVKQSERRYQTLVDNFPNGGVFVFDHDLRYVVAGGLGLSPSAASVPSLVGRTMFEVFTPDEAALLEPLYRDTLAGITQTHVLALSGYLYQAHFSPLRDEHGEVVNGLAVSQDITEQRRLEGALDRSEKQRRLVLGEMLRAEAEERTRIATELHDDSVQVLASTLLTLDRLVGRLRRAGRADEADLAGRAREFLDLATNRTRRLMFELRPAALDAGGLEVAVRAVVRHAAEEVGFRPEFAFHIEGRYDDATEQLIYRTVLEALNNVRKHAHAHTLTVEIHQADGWVEGTVRDDGQGFEVDRILGEDGRRSSLHFGIQTMIERASLAGGELRIESAPGRGTAIRFRLPVTPAAAVRGEAPA